MLCYCSFYDKKKAEICIFSVNKIEMPLVTNSQISNFNPSPGVNFDDTSITTATDQLLTCTLTGLSQDTAVTWIDPDNNEISESDEENYVIDQGSYVFGNKISTLTIKVAKINSLTSGDRFKCKVRSSLYPTYSPEIVKEMTLTILTFGNYGCWALFVLTTIF